MKTITDRGRKILSRFFRVISVSAASLILQACYGVVVPYTAEYGPPPPDNKISIVGKVVSKETKKPILGIKVSIEGSEVEYTNKEGYFYLYGVPIRDVYNINFEDIDGTFNGGLFKGETWPFTQNDIYNTLLIPMDLINN